MQTKPVKHSNETWPEYVGRVIQWEHDQRIEAIAEAKVIDRVAERKRSGFHINSPVTKQTELDRRTIRDLAQNNPILRYILQQQGK